VLDQTSVVDRASVRTRRATVPSVVLLALLAPALVACSGSSDEKPRAGARGDGPSAATAAPVEGQEPAEVDEESPEIRVTKPVSRLVNKGTDAYLDEADDALRSPDPKQPPTSYDHVTGPALEALLNTVAEYDQNGWRVVGQPKVVSREVIHQNGHTLVMRACLDNSKVKVLDAKGKRVPNSKQASARTLNILTLTRLKGEWVVSDQRPATKPDC